MSFIVTTTTTIRRTDASHSVEEARATSRPTAPGRPPVPLIDANRQLAPLVPTSGETQFTDHFRRWHEQYVSPCVSQAVAADRAGPSAGQRTLASRADDEEVTRAICGSHENGTRFAATGHPLHSHIRRWRTEGTGECIGYPVMSLLSPQL